MTYAAALVSWSGLLQVLVFGLVASVVIVTAFSFGLVGLDHYRRASGGGETSVPLGGAVGGLAIAVVCFAICVISVGAGIWSIVVKTS